MWTLGFLVLFFGLLSAGTPIFLVLGSCAAVLYYVSGEPLIGVAQVMIDHLNSSTLMALPMFVMAAAFMRHGGVAKALVDVAMAWLGGIRGSLGLVTVVACTLFAAICGSSVATALAMGTILLPAMIEKGYPRSFALGVIGASGTIGIVIPPSLALIGDVFAMLPWGRTASPWDSGSVLFRQPNRCAHMIEVRGVEPARHVGNIDHRHQSGVVAHAVETERLAHVAIDRGHCLSCAPFGV